MQANSRAVIFSLVSILKGIVKERDKKKIKERWNSIRIEHENLRKLWMDEVFSLGEGESLTPQWLSYQINKVMKGEDAIVVNETITNSLEVFKYIDSAKPDSFFGHGGGSLEWSGGAAIGIKLARPDRTVVSLVGDGSFIFGVPTAVYWVSRRYHAPFLTVIYNNSGWQAVKLSTLRRYPDGYAKNDKSLLGSLTPIPDLTMVAEASGCYTHIIKKPQEVEEALRKGLDEVKKGRSAVIDARF